MVEKKAVNFMSREYKVNEITGFSIKNTSLIVHDFFTLCENRTIYFNLLSYMYEYNIL